MIHSEEVMSFGLHRGRPFGWVADTDPDYCDWALRVEPWGKQPFSVGMKQFRRYLDPNLKDCSCSKVEKEGLEAVMQLLLTAAPHNHLMDVGQYSDKPYCWVLLHDPQYCRWALEDIGEKAFTHELRRFIEYLHGLPLQIRRTFSSRLKRKRQDVS